MITIAPLTDELNMTVQIKDLVLNSHSVFVQTEKHPFIQTLINFNIPYTSMDDLFQSALNFKDLFNSIAERISKDSVDCIYLYLGSAENVIEALNEIGCSYRTVPGVQLHDICFPGIHIGCVYSSWDLPDIFERNRNFCITDIDTVFRSTEVKNALSRFYPDDMSVDIGFWDDTGSVQRKTICLYELDRFSSNNLHSPIVLVKKGDLLDTSCFNFLDLINVIEKLRGNEGCSWDQKQTHESIRNNILEESYEVADAIDKNDPFALCEELGDVLFQIVFHSSIGKQHGEFDFNDVVTGITSKMITRHPSIFSNSLVNKNNVSEKEWRTIKQKEKGYESLYDEMKAVPECFPALFRASKLQTLKKNFYPDQIAIDSLDNIFSKIRQSLDIVQKSTDDNIITNEIAGLLFLLVYLCKYYGEEPEEILQRYNDQFIDINKNT